MANIETIGVRAVAENVDKAISDLNRLNKAVGSVGSQAVATASPLGVLGGALSNVAQIAAGIISAQLINRMAEGLKDLASQAILGAGRVDELEVVLELLGTRAGYATGQLYQWRDAIVDAGIRTDVATELLAQFIRYQIDASEAVKLANVAQNAAVFAAEDSTEALAGLMHGILTQRAIVLRTYGIIIDMNKAFETYGEIIGKNADDLNDAERVQAALNAVIASGASIAGAYAAAMETPSKMLRTLSGRLIPEMIWAMGEPFQQAFHDAVFAISDFVNGLTTAVSEGGRLRPILDALAAAANRLLAPIVALAGVVSQWLGTTAKGAAETANAVVELSQDIATVQVPDLASGFEKQAQDIIRITNDLTKSITRMWEDHNRRLAQTVFDFNLGRLRDELDWQRQQARDLAEHNRKIAEMYAELDELRTGKRRQEIKAGMAAERKTYQDQRAQLVALLGQAQSEEEKLRVQGWIAALDAEHQANADAAQEELDAIDAEQAALEKRIAMEEQAFQRSQALAEEDRRIKLQREDEDFARRLARDEEEVVRREALQREESAERIALVQEGIAAERAARAAAYAEQTAALTTSVEQQKGILGDLSLKQKNMVAEWKTGIEEFANALSAVDWVGFSESMTMVSDSAGSIADALLVITGRFEGTNASMISMQQMLKPLRMNFDGLRKVLDNLLILTMEPLIGSFDVMLTMIAEGPGEALEVAKKHFVNWIDAFGGLFTGLLELVAGFVTGLVGGLLIFVDLFIVAVGGEKTRLSEEFYSVGVDMIEGIIDGVNGAWQRIIDRIRELADAIMYEIKIRLGIASPSKVMFNMGQDIVRGMAEGIRSMGQLPALQMGNVAMGTLAAVPASTSNVSNTYNLNMSSMAPVSTVAADFHLMRVLAGR